MTNELDIWTVEDAAAGKCDPASVGNPRYSDLSARALARRHTAAAIATLVDIASQKEDLTAATKAAQAILDRGWGKPEQTQLNLNPPPQAWPEWLTQRRLAYQESSQYAEDIVAREVPPALPAPPTAPGSIPPLYPLKAKSQPGQANVVPPENGVKSERPKAPTIVPPAQTRPPGSAPNGNRQEQRVSGLGDANGKSSSQTPDPSPSAS